MKKIVWLGIGLGLWASLAWGQYGYQYVSGGWWFGAQFIGQEGWMVGAGGAILHTTDGGNNWVFQNNIERKPGYAPPNLSFNDVYFTSLQEGWTCIDTWTPYVWHTTDGGRFWKAESLPLRRQWSYAITSKIVFVDPLTGWIAGGSPNPEYDYGNILATTNGGRTWAYQDTSHGWLGIYATDAHHCWAVGNNGWTARTTDGGTTWIRLQAGAIPSLLDVFFRDTLNGWACGQAGAIIHSTNGGATWTAQNNNSDKDLYRIRVLTSLSGTAVGDEGTIVTTTDGGNSWWGWWSPPCSSNALTAISFVDTLHGWIIGEGGAILETTSGGGWGWGIKRLGTTERLQGISFLDEQHGWAASWEGNIWHTNDSGKTWQSQDMVAKPDRLQGLAMANANTGWAVGKSGLVMATQDGGGTWYPQAFLQQANLKNVFASDAQHAWACGSQMEVVGTSDGGQTWGVQFIRPDTTLYDITFSDSLHGWALFQDGHLLRTKNKGQTWAFAGTVGKGNWYHLSFVDSLWGWAAGDSGVSRTTDGGSSWVKQSTGVIQRFWGILGRGRARAWAVGVNGVIIATTDGGATWNFQTHPVTTIWRGVDFADSLRGAACGDRYIINTTDGGNTWVQRYSGGNCYALTLVDSLEGWAVGNNERILHTIDGGNTWQAVHSGQDTLRAIRFINRNEGWTGGEGSGWGSLLHTTDGGVTWTLALPTALWPIFSLFFTDGLHGWLGTGGYFPGQMWATTDGGTGWIPLLYPRTVVSAGQAASSRTGVACGSLGTLLRTTDGSNWERVMPPSPRNLWGIGMGDEQTAWAVGQSDMVIASTDQGLSWRVQKAESLSDSLLMSVQAFDGLTARATGYLGLSVLTTDGGSTWQGEETGTKEWLLASSFLTPTLGWVAGENGMVLKYGRLPYGVEEEKGKPTMPLVTSLGQNHPNPFPERTEIMYQLANKGKVRLVVYNVLGQAVRRVVEKDQEPGFYAVSWDGRDDDGRSVSSGVYFYRLDASGRTETRKMVKVR